MLQLRYIGIPHNQLEIPGFCICGESEAEVMEIADMALLYYETPGFKPPIKIGFRKNREGTLDFLMDFGALVGNVDIRDVQAAIPERVERGLDNVEAYCILLGFGIAEVTIVDAHVFHMLRFELEVDGRVVRGTKTADVNWRDLFRG